MSKEDLRRSLRHASKENRLGHEAVCEKCGVSEIRVLQWTQRETLCAECRLEKQGKSRTEYHHPAGINNDLFMIQVLANVHALFSDYQIDWPDMTLKNPKGDILHRRAAWQRWNRDSYMRQANKAEIWAEELEEFAAWLDEEIGPDWWEKYQKRRKGGEE